eukprot:g2647.t1
MQAESAFLSSALLAISLGLCRRKRREEQSFGSDEIFFGSEPIYFKRVQGYGVVVEPSSCSVSKSSSESTRERFYPIPARIGDGTLPAIVPCIPRLDIEVPGKPSPAAWASKSPLPFEPWIKVTRGDEDSSNHVALKAYASGVRSGLVKSRRGVWYRLKGCGNHDQGFVVQPTRVKVYDDDGRAGSLRTYYQVRGCAFVHTAICDNYVSAQLNAKANLVPCANRPIGHWIYQGTTEMPITKCDAEKGKDPFQTACIVQQTYGDRRLYTHLLSGLLLLMDHLIDPIDARVNDFLALFPDKRPTEIAKGSSQKPGVSPLTLPVDTSHFVDDQTMYESYLFQTNNAEQVGNGVHGFTWQVPRNPQTLARCLDFDFEEHSPEALPCQWVLDKRGKEDCCEMDPRWYTAWTSSCEKLDQLLGQVRKKGKMSVLPYLFSRLGYECGIFLNMLHADCNTSWGTFQDSMCHESEWHCNAHANNMVVLSPDVVRQDAGTRNEHGRRDKSFLGFLDLDMAFDEQAFVNPREGRVSNGANASTRRQKFRHLLKFEHSNFRSSLASAGGSSGLRRPGVLDAEAKGWRERPKYRLVRTALFDQLILSFDFAYDNGVAGLAGTKGLKKMLVAQYDEDLHSAAMEMVKLALILQSRYLA